MKDISHTHMHLGDQLTINKASLPWYQHGMDNFELAVTGNAFLYLIQRIKQKKIANPDDPKAVAN